MKVGMEIEIPSCTSSIDFRSIIACDIHNDGSLRSHNVAIDDMSIVTNKSELLYDRGWRTENIGLELVTVVYEVEQLLPILETLRDLLHHVPTHPRSSVHIHIDYTNQPWVKVRNLCEWFYVLEAVLYRLAACGGIHRGEMEYEGIPQDHRYARPLSAPICARFSRSIKPVIDTKALFRANDATTFLAAWGRLDVMRGSSHYIPHRLHGINIYPLLYQGSVELRIFNGCYRFLPEMLKIASALYNLSENRPDIEPMLLGEQPNIKVDEVSNIFGFDVSPMWGKHWPKPILNRSLTGHYSNNSVPSGTIELFRNNRDQMDTGEDDFSIYKRRIVNV